jgi:hypothetical protein
MKRFYGIEFTITNLPLVLITLTIKIGTGNLNILVTTTRIRTGALFFSNSGTEPKRGSGVGTRS